MAPLMDNVNKAGQDNADISAALSAQHLDVSDYKRLSQAAGKINLIHGMFAEAPNSLYAFYEYIEV